MTTNNFCFVVDSRGVPLSPTKENKGWYLIRKGKAVLKLHSPMVIQLLQEVENTDLSEIRLGIDDGSIQAGLSITQKCSTKMKTLFKGVLNLRQDVSKLMTERVIYRRYRRKHKRYRKVRFLNRASSRKSGRLAPSIRQKKDSILRTLSKLIKFIRVDRIYLEDVKIDIQKILYPDLYPNEYRLSKRLDENLRKATLMRDQYSCRMCSASECRLEAHHIHPRRLGGSDSIENLITLCSPCHKKVTGKELDYEDYFYDLAKGFNLSGLLKVASHVMVGKSYLRKELEKVAPVVLTTGSETSNKRIYYGIDKTHPNDAICCTVDSDNYLIRFIDQNVYVLKPVRRRPSTLRKQEEFLGFKHKDVVFYTPVRGRSSLAYVSGFSYTVNQLKLTLKPSNEKKTTGITRVKFIYRMKGIDFTKLNSRKEELVS